VVAWPDAWEQFTPFCGSSTKSAALWTRRTRSKRSQLRKAIKTKGHFPSEDAARKLIYLAIQNAIPQSTPTRAWTKALLAFKTEFGSRLPNAT
jgi:putative transposase